MLNKILLALGVVFAISALGSALTCNRCYYTSAQPKAQQKCDSRATANCPSGTAYCYTTTYTTSGGIAVVDRNCDSKLGDKYCPNAVKTCSEKTRQDDLKSCLGVCCATDNCNNFTPSNSASGVMVTKFILGFMVIAGFLFA